FHIIMLAAPTTPLKRFRRIASCSRGFIYYVSLTGVTGARRSVSKDLKKKLALFKKATNKPICVGFGVSDPRQAKEISTFADGVIIGSAIVRIIEKNLGNKKRMLSEVRHFARSVAGAVKGAGV
ncbi:MAG: tryptophan synthase subunit alpha, partial [Candidatus Omnitrophica bacterium]|nr:tryptophan synthase subunit alpha [Candidatus Omnitrophota bacterium]